MLPVTAARLLLGAGGLLLTRRVLPLWGADPRSERAVEVARVLAARHLAQALVVTAHPSRRTRLAGVAVDGLHALSMVALAAVRPSYRRPAVTSAVVSVALAASLGMNRYTPAEQAHIDLRGSGKPRLR